MQRAIASVCAICVLLQRGEGQGGERRRGWYWRKIDKIFEMEMVRVSVPVSMCICNQICRLAASLRRA